MAGAVTQLAGAVMQEPRGVCPSARAVMQFGTVVMQAPGFVSHDSGVVCAECRGMRAVGSVALRERSAMSGEARGIPARANGVLQGALAPRASSVADRSVSYVVGDGARAVCADERLLTHPAAWVFLFVLIVGCERGAIPGACPLVSGFPRVPTRDRVVAWPPESPSSAPSAPAARLSLGRPAPSGALGDIPLI